MKKCLPCIMNERRCKICNETYCPAHAKEYKINTGPTIPCCIRCIGKKLSGVRNALRKNRLFTTREIFVAQCSCGVRDIKIGFPPRFMRCSSCMKWVEYKEESWTGPDKF